MGGNWNMMTSCRYDGTEVPAKFQLNVKYVGHNLGVFVNPITHVPQELQRFHFDDEQSELAEETILSSVSSDED